MKIPSWVLTKQIYIFQLKFVRNLRLMIVTYHMLSTFHHCRPPNVTWVPSSPVDREGLGKRAD